MLYVSSKLKDNTYMVTDTDDGVETEVNVSSLPDILKLGIKIHGVDVVKTGNTQQLKVRVIDTEKSSALRTKTKVMKGVDITVIDGSILSIRFGRESIKSDCAIRLSDFGKSCEPHMFKTSGYIWDYELDITHKCTFILDDNIDITDSSFAGAFNFDFVRVDVSEVTNTDTVKLIYDCLYSSWFDGSGFYDIIDKNRHRKRLFRNLGIIYSDDFADQYKAEPKYSKELYKYFESAFNWFLDQPIGGIELLLSQREVGLSSVIDAFADEIYVSRNFWRRHPTDYEQVRNKVLAIKSPHALTVACYLTPAQHILTPKGVGGGGLMYRFMVYRELLMFIYHYQIPNDLKQKFVKWCDKYYNTIIDYHDQAHKLYEETHQ